MTFDQSKSNETQQTNIFIQNYLLSEILLHRSGKSRLYQPGGDSDGVGTMVTDMENGGTYQVTICRQEGRTWAYLPGASAVSNLAYLSIRFASYPIVIVWRLISLLGWWLNVSFGLFPL